MAELVVELSSVLCMTLAFSPHELKDFFFWLLEELAPPAC